MPNRDLFCAWCAHKLRCYNDVIYSFDWTLAVVHVEWWYLKYVVVYQA